MWGAKRSGSGRYSVSHPCTIHLDGAPRGAPRATRCEPRRSPAARCGGGVRPSTSQRHTRPCCHTPTVLSHRSDAAAPVGQGVRVRLGVRHRERGATSTHRTVLSHPGHAVARRPCRRSRCGTVRVVAVTELRTRAELRRGIAGAPGRALVRYVLIARRPDDHGTLARARPGAAPVRYRPAGVRGHPAGRRPAHRTPTRRTPARRRRRRDATLRPTRRAGVGWRPRRRPRRPARGRRRGPFPARHPRRRGGPRVRAPSSSASSTTTSSPACAASTPRCSPSSAAPPGRASRPW